MALDDPKGLSINGISNWQSAWLLHQAQRQARPYQPELQLAASDALDEPATPTYVKRCLMARV